MNQRRTRVEYEINLSRIMAEMANDWCRAGGRVGNGMYCLRGGRAMVRTVIALKHECCLNDADGGDWEPVGGLF